jgi:hypothetical protein
VHEAFRAVVHDYGVEYLAGVLGVRPGTLYNKADGGDEAHNQPNLRDVVQVTQATGDMRIVEAMAETFGLATFACTPTRTASDEALLELLTTLGAEHGEFHQALGAALSGKRFTLEAYLRIRSEAFDVVSALMTLVQRVEGLLDDATAGEMAEIRSGRAELPSRRG